MLTYVATNYEPDANRSYPVDTHEKWGYFPDDDMVRSADGGHHRCTMSMWVTFVDAE